MSVTVLLHRHAVVALGAFPKTISRRLRLTLAAALSVTVGCSPTFPTQEERFPLYSGQWRGVIGQVQVVLQIQAQRGYGSPALGGTGTYLNGTTGQNGRLTVSGLGNLDDTATLPALLNLRTADEVRPDGVVTKVGQFMGQFIGNPSDPRTWPGQFEGPRLHGSDYDGIFEVSRASVTFIKD